MSRRRSLPTRITRGVRRRSAVATWTGCRRSPGPPQNDQHVQTVHGDLIDLLPLAEFALADVEFINEYVGAGGAVAEGDIELESDAVVGVVPAKDLREQ